MWIDLYTYKRIFIFYLKLTENVSKIGFYLLKYLVYKNKKIDSGYL